MADRLKGIVVEIGGDTEGLDKALKDVNDSGRKLQSELSDVQRLLKFNPESAELLAQRQTLLNQQIENTSKKLNRLKQVEAQVQGQLDRGEIGQEQFRAFQREIVATEGRLRHFEREAQGTARDVKGVFKKMGGGIASAIAGAAAGAGIGTVVTKSLEAAHLETQIKVGFDVPADSVGKVKEIVTSIQNYGVEGEAALEGVRKQFALNADMSVEQNQKIVDSAAVIATTYNGIDFTELIQESNEFGEAIGISQQDALAMTNQLLKMGFPPDQLDIMAEYGSQLKRAGYNAIEIQGIFQAGVETKSWNIDVLLDGVKEGRIRLAEFGQGVDKTTAGLIKGTNISAKELQTWGTAVAEGGQAGKIAFGEVATELSKVKNENDRNAIGSRLFGTLWEEQGKKITDAMAGANDKTITLKGNNDKLNESMAAAKADPQYRYNKALTDMQNTLAPLLTTVAEFMAKIADWISKNPQLAAGITAVVVALGILIGIFIALVPVIAGLTGAAAALDIAILPLTATILAWIAVIGLLIAIGVLVYKNWDKIKERAAKSWGEIKTIIMGAGKRIADHWHKAINDFKSAWETVTNKLKEIGQRISKQWNDAIADLKAGWNKLKSWFDGIDLTQTGKDIIHGLVSGMEAMWDKVKETGHKIATTVKEAIKNKLKITSPSKVMFELGFWTAQGFIDGLHGAVEKVQKVSLKLSKAITSSVTESSNHGPLQWYFDAIRKDGDYMNDWLTHLPKQFRSDVLAMGKALAPQLKGTKVTNDSVFTKGNVITVNLNSPKALDVREANRQFTRTMNKMSLQW